MTLPGDTGNALWRGIKQRLCEIAADNWLLFVAVALAIAAFIVGGTS